MICRVVLTINAASQEAAALVERLLADELTTITGARSPSLRFRRECRDASVDVVVTCDVAAVREAAQIQSELVRRVRARILAEGLGTPIGMQASAFWRHSAAEYESTGDSAEGRHAAD